MAAKVHDIGILPPELRQKSVHAARQEFVQAHRALHPNVLTSYGICVTDDEAIVVSERMVETLAVSYTHLTLPTICSV